ncbi:MAG: glycolate oxidase subunit GlcE [Betaproteobacteria bacterium]
MIEQFAETIRQAATEGGSVRIRGGGTKDFYGVALEGRVLDTRGYAGVVDYEPSELVITVRAGTPLTEVERVLAERGQMLAFDPPHLGPDSTIGGAVASGFSGPRRAAAGSARDFVLGVRVLDSSGRDLSFGGQVMKNVAGYDLSRFVTGSFGTLALITEASVKVLPRPVAEATLRFEMDESAAIAAMNHWAGQPLPLSGTCFHEGTLWVRLSGARAAVEAAVAKLGGELPADAEAFWSSIRNQTHPFFAAATPLWRMSIRSSAPPLGLGAQLIEWNGSLRWVAADVEHDAAHAAAHAWGGHATLFRGGAKAAGIMRLAAPVLALHKRIKRSLDPNSVFGRHRMHPEF